MTDLNRLRADGCPDPNCDGKGTICLGAHDHGDGDIEYQLEQCRYCDERQEAADALDAKDAEIERLEDASISWESDFNDLLHQKRAQDAEIERLKNYYEKTKALLDSELARTQPVIDAARDYCNYTTTGGMKRLLEALADYDDNADS
jgi:hypothetical protein